MTGQVPEAVNACMQGSSAKMDSNTSATITFAGFLAGEHLLFEMLY